MNKSELDKLAEEIIEKRMLDIVKVVMQVLFYQALAITVCIALVAGAVWFLSPEGLHPWTTVNYIYMISGVWMMSGPVIFGFWRLRKRVIEL